MNEGQSPLHVLFLASWYPNRLEPQNGNFIQRHAQAVAGYAQVAVLHAIADAKLSEIELSKSWNNGVYEVIVYFPKANSWNPLSKMNSYLEAHRVGYQAITKELGTVDLVHLNVFFRAGLFAMELKKRYQIPYIVTEHLTAFLESNPYKFSWYEKYFIRKIAKRAALICPVSEDLKVALERFGIQGPFRIVPNVVDTKLFHPPPAPRSLEKIRLLHVSTLNEAHKNFSGMLRVIKRLSEVRTDFEMTFVGNNFGEASVAKARALDLLDKFVNIRNEIPIEEIAALMREHHLFMLFSNYENLPCVISEAHASGMVVIATDVGGVREMINEQNGILIDAKDEEALLRSIVKVMDQIKSYGTEMIGEQAKERYSYEQVGQKFTDIYRDVLARK